jgi:cellulose synthase/poly-beta-1,6-N-acetylglucosamine synthase-like glycosyltransferase
MRRIGAQAISSRYIMFLDGDCELVDGFLEVAIRRMEDQPDLGVVAGARRDYYRTPGGIIPAPENYYTGRRNHPSGQPAYGGCALYRAEALLRSGSFDPFLGASEEAELSFRIRKAGFKIAVLDVPMIRHMTVPRESPDRLLRTLRHGFFAGRGQAARLFLSRGLFRSALHGLDRPLAILLHLFLGVCALWAWNTGPRWPLALWLTVSAIAMLVFLLRTKSPRRVIYYVAEWLAQGVFLIIGFLAPRRSASDFKWEGEVYAPGDLAGASRAD